MNTEDHERALDAQFAISEASLVMEVRDPADDSRVPCRVQGCRNDAPRRGPYAGRCKDHQHLSAAMLNGDQAVVQQPDGSLLVAAAQAIEDARDALAQAELLLEQRIADLRDLLIREFAP